MCTKWPFQEASDRLENVVEDANQLGPQVITKDGINIAVVLSYVEYSEMIASSQKLSDFFRKSPLAEGEFNLERDKSKIRNSL